MNSKKENIIIFKSDRVGDLIHFSPCINIIKENVKNSYITLVCSKYNYQVAKNYKSIDKYIVLDNNKIFTSILLNFKVFFLQNINIYSNLMVKVNHIKFHILLMLK